jgi:hypothetical protein
VASPKFHAYPSHTYSKIMEQTFKPTFLTTRCAGFAVSCLHVNPFRTWASRTGMFKGTDSGESGDSDDSGDLVIAVTVLTVR